MPSRWKAELLTHMGPIFDKAGKAEAPDVYTQGQYAQIGQRKVEKEFLNPVSGILWG